MQIPVRLTDDQIEFSDRISHEHHAARVAAGSRHRNNRPINREKDLADKIMATRCEHAAHIGLGTTFWDTGPLTYINGQKRADLDDFIDVRARRYMSRDLLIQFRDPPEYAYVSVCAQYHPLYIIDGWCWGYEGQLEEFIHPLANRPAYAVPIRDLRVHDPFLLKLRVQERAAASRPMGDSGPTRV